MTGHQKRLSVPDVWPVSRKTETFTVKADAGPHGEDGVPLVIVLRDVLGYVDSLRETRYALNHGTVRINGDIVDDARRPVGMFDIVAFTGRGEYYRVFPGEGGRLALTPIAEEDAGSKLGKVIGKRQVQGGDTQLNLHDGGNILVEDEGYGVGDSVIVDNDDGSIVAHFPYEEGCLVTAVDGAHSGEVGRVLEIDVSHGSSPNRVVFETIDEQRSSGNRSSSGDDDGTYETIEDYVVVIDEQFAGDEVASDDAEPADDEQAPAEDEAAADAEAENGDDTEAVEEVTDDE